jgi:hypothetical protein
LATVSRLQILFLGFEFFEVELSSPSHRVGAIACDVERSEIFFFEANPRELFGLQLLTDASFLISF